MSEPSPYRQAGIEAGIRVSVALRRKSERPARGIFGSAEAFKNRHIFGNMYKRQGLVIRMQECRLCRQPKFAVDGMPCIGITKKHKEKNGR